MAKNNEQQQEQPNVADVGIYVEALGRSYEPARNPSETTHWFSTEEVVTAIRQIDPSAKVDDTQVFHALHDAGYEFCNRPSSQGLQFKWMFREKPSE